MFYKVNFMVLYDFCYKNKYYLHYKIRQTVKPGDFEGTPR